MTPLAAQQDGTEAEDVLDRNDARWLRLREISARVRSNAGSSS
jgi:hypothetical protein